jgi:hypothetical protein
MSMTPAQLIEEIKNLSPEDKRALLDKVFKIVQDESDASVPRDSLWDRLQGIGKPEFGKRDESQNSQRSLSKRLFGVLRFDGEPPNDEEVKELIADYLIRKYS